MMKKGNKSGAHQALYRKYRSRKLSDVVGQQHVTDTLEVAIKSGNISHAYLFSGPRGVGKTSVARILAHEINSLDYEHNSNHLDIIEIDAASNRRIDDIRDLRAKVGISPAQAKYKVYIIDEVHMLTKESFNALLKTLEEPPAHAVFILATTESHKLPATIISRAQHYQFRTISAEQISQHLAEIAALESIDITKPALDLIATRSQGGMRDALGMLDQLSNTSASIDLNLAEKFLGLASVTSVNKLADATLDGALTSVAETYQNIIADGVDVQSLISQLYEYLKTKALESNNPKQIVELMNDVLKANSGYDPRIELESTLYQHAASIDSSNADSKPVNTKASTKQASVVVSSDVVIEKIPTKQESPKVIEPTEPRQIKPKTNTTPAPTNTNSIDDKTWQQIIDEIKTTNNTLAGLLSQSIVEFNQGKLEVFCRYSFHVKRLQTAKYQAVLSDTVSKILVSDIEVIVSQNSQKFEARQEEEESSLTESVQAVKDILGGELINV